VAVRRLLRLTSAALGTSVRAPGLRRTFAATTAAS
jgi:hypothetical protein